MVGRLPWVPGGRVEAGVVVNRTRVRLSRWADWAGAPVIAVLRSSELWSLTKAQVFLENNPPFVVCKAGSAKNRVDARQYVAHAPVFTMPRETNVARMLRADLATARSHWLHDAAKDPDEYLRRTQSDFLCETNHAGEVFDFHGLRHTCGAWSAMTGAHPKVVQTMFVGYCPPRRRTEDNAVALSARRTLLADLWHRKLQRICSSQDAFPRDVVRRPAT
jgi:hypothetical protein